MRKAAGFLLVLLLATLVVIATSSGDENDSSHVVHLTATYGPQITCADCHGTETPPLLSDGQNLTFTTVCDTCHSPGGAFNGVDDPNIGAKTNWATGVFTGGELTPGKEQWCVGCHDDVPSVINGVSAPNIAGDDIDYGYYKTGHGKYVSESITCLACHDPASEHVVDGVARTYSAATDNYQAGYRLKSVGGQAPLVIPRPATPVTADQFRQCFSCHNSAPFMNSDNTDTNFRADVNDLCVALDPPANRHWEHLSLTGLTYDSDFDGVSADSPPSCPACHNVHGPRLSDGLGVTNAPAMIRTGELIGLGSSLNLEYFINPCPDDLTLSPTNETVDSTGGIMKQYLPAGSDGSLATNGVCIMCHNDAEAYWRVAKTLPPVQAGNDFSLDGNAVALWGLDNGALTTDSIGTNTLTDNNTVGTDTVDYQVGNASADFVISNSESLTITDANLDSGFPYKDGETNKDITVTLWVRPHDVTGTKALWSKWDSGSELRSLFIGMSNNDFWLLKGKNGTTGAEVLVPNTGNEFQANQWYHIAVTYKDSDKTWYAKIWDETAGSATEYSGTATFNNKIATAAVVIGASLSSGSKTNFMDGNIDEVVVFNDILTTGEIDQIRQGTYAVVYTPTTTTTLFPPTTTTTLPPAQNDFSGDGNAVALWSVDNGALTTDSIGTNTLFDNNTVGTDTVNYQEGYASADFIRSNSESLTISDANLDSGFPYKGGETNKDITVTFWVRPHDVTGTKALWSKWDAGSELRSLFIGMSNNDFWLLKGKNGTTGAEVLVSNTGNEFQANQWYHIAVTYKDSDKTWYAKIWDETAGSAKVYSGTATFNNKIATAAVVIGASLSSGSKTNFMDGNIDEVVVFNDILTTGEIDQIRQGTYAVVPPTTTTTTTLPPTTTTTLPPGDYPTLSSATLGTDGTTLTLVFNQSVDIGVGGSGGFDIDVSGSTQNIACTYSSGSGSTTLIYTTGQTLLSGATLNLDYAQPGDGVEATDDGFDVLTFADASITNNSTATTTTTTTTSTTTTTLPYTGNDFAGDGNVKASWRLNNGALTTDSIGTNTLTDNNTVGTDTVNYQEGDASADFVRSNSESLTITDANLNSGFPLKSGETNKDISVAFWVRPHDVTGIKALWSKWDAGSELRSLFIGMNDNDFWLLKGKNGTVGAEVLVPNTGNEFQANQWYHIAVTYKDSDKTWYAKIWDETAGSAKVYSGTATFNNKIATAAVVIGASLSSGSKTNFMDGNIDEVVVFNDILTTGEIDQIRQGTLGSPTTTTTTLPPTTTTTTTTTTTLPVGTTTTTTLPVGTTTTTLPPAPGTNDFSADGNVKALWSVENGALSTDFSGNGNTLTDNNTVGTDTVNYKEGVASADFVRNNSESLSISDANLDSGFPYKDGETNRDISVAFWVRPHDVTGTKALWTKWDAGSELRSLFIGMSNNDFWLLKGKDGDIGSEVLVPNTGNEFQANQWYHIAVTYKDRDKTWYAKIWDETAGSATVYSGTATFNNKIATAAVVIGASLSSGSKTNFMDGNIDEVVVFNDILTTDEIDKIRQGTYEDLCPLDPNKSEPGVCGCGITEWVDSNEISYCIDNDTSHSAHLTDAYGPQIASCDVCHVDSYAGLFTDGLDLANTQVCATCHSPLGAYDGVDDPNIGAKPNWASGVFTGPDLTPGKEKWCVGCHDDVPSVINSVSAPNMAGDDIDYGYYKTGHGKHGYGRITCLACHDPALMHVDGVARTYSAAADNYQDGYRLKLVDGLPALVVPRPVSNLTEGLFRLCFTCHDSTPFMNVDNTNTNFRADVNDTGASLVPPANRHWTHLSEIFLRYDSDFDGVSPDSAISCNACHNVHGPRLKAGAGITHAPAMIRTGELIGRESEGALNLEYFINPWPDTTTSPTNELTGSTGGAMMNDPQQYVNTSTKGGVCRMCHTTVEPYWRDAKDLTSCASGNCHTAGSHATHLTAEYGPHIACDDCHNTNNFPQFSDGGDLENTDVCDTCHSPGGTYDGVNEATVGAKDNWEAGVYDEEMALQPGKEKWCAGCHDEEPSYIDGVYAPNVIGDEDSAYTYGTGWGYYKTGHGLTSGAAYPSKGGLIEPPLINGAARPVECDSCHNFSTAHIDGLARTYDDGDSSTTDPSVYRIAYRLDLVPEGEGSGTSTKEPLLVPWPGGGTPNVAENAPLCYKCHDPNPFIVNDNPDTNLETDFDSNLHEYHLTIGNNQIYQTDWSGTKNSQVTCVVCHNVHGSTRLAMVRDGKLVSQTPGIDIEPGLQIWYKNDAISTYATNNTEPPSPEDLPLAASDGTVWIGNSSANLCTHCHANDYTIGEDRTPFQYTSQAPTLDWTGEAGYVSDGVSPDAEASGATFTFRVKYTDINNEAPSPINLLIDTNSDGNADDTYAMTGADVGDVNYMNGRIYTKDLVLTDNVQYKFAASDGTDPATGSPTVWRAVSLLAGVVNNAPELAWVSDTCRYQGVSPATAVSGTGFEFYVEYTDANDQFASLQVWVDLNDDGDYDDIDEKQDMTVDSGDGDYSNGENFTKTITLSYAGDGMLNYRFVASDGIEAATGDPVGVQSVTVTDSGLTPITVCASGCDQTSIQDGIDAARSGDKFTLVNAGTYNENLSLWESSYSNSIVRSVCGPDATTISNPGNVVFLQNVSGVVIDGFQITGGTRGINSNGGSATINKCKIHDNNNTTGRGGGLQSGNASGILKVVNSEIYSNTSLGGSAASFNAGYGHTFTNTKIYDNHAIYNIAYSWSGSGGAVFTQNGDVTFTDTIIDNNLADKSSGAVDSNGSNVNFIRSTITGNTATGGSGGAIVLGNGTENAYLENCIVADNQANAGGVAFVNGAAFTAIHSTFVGNQANAGDGGILWQQNATSEFRNSILWNNTASAEGHIAWFNGGSMRITDTVIASGNDGIPTNAPYFASSNNDITPSVSGYVSENDPFFVDAENGDYHLKYFSPAIDQGTPEDPPLSVDIDGDPRPFDWVGLGDGVDDYDIGADEVTEQDQSTVDSLSTTDSTAIESGPIDADESIVMSRFQVDCNDTGDSQCILESVTIEDIAFGLSGDWDNLEIYIDTDTNFTGATLIGQEASWDGSAVTVGLDQGTQADRTVTYGTPKYVFIVYDITEAAEGKALQSRLTQVNAIFPDYGVTGLSYESNVVPINGDSLSTSNNTAIQATGPGAGEANIVMQRFQADCGATGNNACILSDITVTDYGTAITGDWDSLDIYIDTDTDFSGATLIGQSSFDGTSTAVNLDKGTVADRTVTNGTSKYIFIVYDINSGAEGKTILSWVTGVGVESPDDGVALNYGSNLLTVQEAGGGDNLSTSNPAAVHTEYADQGEYDAVMERFQVDCDTAGDSYCILSSITVNDLGTASTGDWDNLNIYIDTDTSFAGATKIGQTSSWDGTSTIVSLSLGTEGDRTVTNGTSKYVFIVYDLNGSIAVDTTLQSRVTAVGVSYPDIGVTGITYDSDVVTVKDAIYVGSGEMYETIQAAVEYADTNSLDGATIIVSGGTYGNVNHSPTAIQGYVALHIYSANGPENTIIDGGGNGSVVTFGDRSSTSTLSGFTITNGDASLSIGGAGIYISMAQPTIDNCIITGNDAGTLPGGGIHVNHSSSDVTITDTIISNNNGGNGGGLYLPSGTNATISNVVFDQNTGDLGGAIYFNATDNTTTITDSTFTGNSSTSGGGAFFMQGINGIKFSRCTITGNHASNLQYSGGVLKTGNACYTTFENCIIADNYAPQGGVFSPNGGAITLTNCTVANNTATGEYSSDGGGIAYICSGLVNMTNSIAWGNSATSGNGHNVYRTCTGPTGANVGTISYSDFDSTKPTFMYQANIINGGGNIDPATDPSFDMGGTYHLTSSSTNVIDVGTSSGAPSDDIDGDSRPQGSGYDMGADEYVP